MNIESRVKAQMCVFKLSNRINKYILTILYVKGKIVEKQPKMTIFGYFWPFLGTRNRIAGEKLWQKWLYMIKLGISNYGFHQFTLVVNLKYTQSMNHC